MRKQLIGIVTGDKCSQTRRVEVPRQYRHPKYGKIVRTRTVCHVHDEQNESRRGDRVEIVGEFDPEPPTGEDAKTGSIELVYGTLGARGQLEIRLVERALPVACEPPPP